MPVKDRQAYDVRVACRKDVLLEAGPSTWFCFDGLPDGKDHFALGIGKWQQHDAPLVRIHSECITGDTFRSRRCDCGDQLQEALDRLHEHGGLLLYLRQEGRGTGLKSKLKAYALQDHGLDTFQADLALGQPADARHYNLACDMLRALGVSRIRLLTNNPDKVRQIREGGLVVCEVLPTLTYLKAENRAYLRAKREVTGHHLSLS